MPLSPYVVKATCIFEQGSNGWTESYWWQGLSGDLYAQAAALLQIMNKRRVMLGAQSGIRAFKVSYETDSLGNSLLQDSLLSYDGRGGLSTQPSDFADTALLLTWKDATGQRSKQQFLRGIWDVIVDSGGGYNKIAAWATNLNSWLNQMFLAVAGVKAASVGWIRRTPLAAYTRTITGYTADASGYVTMTLNAAVPIGVLQPTVTGIPLNRPLEVRVKNLNTTSNLNGQLLVTAINPTVGATTFTQVVTTRPIGVIPFRSPGTITWYDSNLILVGLDSTTSLPTIKDQKIVERKVGAPLLESRGRRKAKPRA